MQAGDDGLVAGCFLSHGYAHFAVYGKKDVNASPSLA